MSRHNATNPVNRISLVLLIKLEFRNTERNRSFDADNTGKVTKIDVIYHIMFGKNSTDIL